MSAIQTKSVNVNLFKKFSEVETREHNNIHAPRTLVIGSCSYANNNISPNTIFKHFKPGRHVIKENIYAPPPIVEEVDGTEICDIEGYFDIGDPNYECHYYGACMWYQERTQKHKTPIIPKFQLCCGIGKIQLPLLTTPPTTLQHLLFDNRSNDSKNYQQHIRSYNMMFAFTSPGAKLDRSFNDGRGPPTFRIQGQACHHIGSLLPMLRNAPKFAQLYIYDTENEIQNRIAGLSNEGQLDAQIVCNLSVMLDEHNTHVKSFRMAKERYQFSRISDLKLKLISDRVSDGRIYNLPSVSEVAALIVGDVDNPSKRDIVLEKQSGQLKRINELHTSYLAYQYPLLFPYGEDGYRHDVCFSSRCSRQYKRNRVTIKDWMCFRLQGRKNEPQTLLRSRRLFQQFVVDGYCMMESDRLNWVRNNQTQLRVDNYVGFPDLFITFTCNPNWPEIKRLLGPLNLKPQDRPDILARVFKIKFDELLIDLKKRHVLGKYPSPEDIDQIITAEIPNIVEDQLLHELVKSHMLHGPCGTVNIKSPCMTNGKCSKYFPKKIQKNTIVDPDGYPIYRRRDNGNTIDKNGISLDNRHVVPYNRNLLLKYQAHINMEWCNQSTSIKYLFKYIHKGYDRVTTTIVPTDNETTNEAQHVDEIKQYVDCRYMSPCEACWRMFSFSIHGRSPAVERLYFHLENEQSVIFNDSEAIDDVLSKPTVKQSISPAVERLYFHLENEQSVIFNDSEAIDDVLSKPTVKQSMFTSWME
ncbi:PREDICTED: uncharacterized protein LOC109338549, partial [Lupinus angustifolius]|uniref:uncharacterized protein LOC109338549 n=1 Tax=Lupinus angustifolius TaxID=3871 RepID=UPI00092E7667